MPLRTVVTVVLNALVTLGFSQTVLWTRGDGPNTLLKDGSLGVSRSNGQFILIDTQTQLVMGVPFAKGERFCASSSDGKLLVVATSVYDDRDRWVGDTYRVVTVTGRVLLEFFRNDAPSFEFTADHKFLLQKYWADGAFQTACVSLKGDPTVTFTGTIVPTESDSLVMLQREDGLYRYDANKKDLRLLTSTLPAGFQLTMAHSLWAVGLANGTPYAISRKNGSVTPVSLEPGEELIGFLEGPNLLVSKRYEGKVRLVSLLSGESKPLPDTMGYYIAISPDRSRIVSNFRNGIVERFRPSDGDRRKIDWRAWSYGFNESSQLQAISSQGYWQILDNSAREVERRDWTDSLQSDSTSRSAFSLDNDTAILVQKPSFDRFNYERMDLKTGVISKWFENSPFNYYDLVVDGSRSAYGTREVNFERFVTTYGNAGKARDLKLRARYPSFQGLTGFDHRGDLLGTEYNNYNDEQTGCITTFDPKTGDVVRRILLGKGNKTIYGINDSKCVIDTESGLALLNLITEQITPLPEPVQAYRRGHSIFRIVPSKDGKWVAMTSPYEGSAVFSTVNGRKILDFPGAWTLQFSPDGKRLLAISFEKTSLIGLSNQP